MSDYAQLHAYVVSAIDDIRRRFGEANIGEFRFDIECSGRTQTGEPKISYRLSTGGYTGDGAATGARLAPTIDEVLRRHSWNKRNDPIALAPPEIEPAPSDPIAF